MCVTITHRSEGYLHKGLRSGSENPDLPVGLFVSGGNNFKWERREFPFKLLK